MLLCMASSPQQSLQSRLFGFWAPSGDEVTVLKIDKDSLYYVDEYPIVAIPYQFAGDSIVPRLLGEHYRTTHLISQGYARYEKSVGRR